MKAALDKTIAAFGRLDFAFNNAGVEQKLALTAELAVEEWDRVVDTKINIMDAILDKKGSDI